MTDTDKLEEIRTRWSGTDSYPWAVDSNDELGVCSPVSGHLICRAWTPGTAKMIAAAPEHVAFLLQHIEQLQAEKAGGELRLCPQCQENTMSYKQDICGVCERWNS